MTDRRTDGETDEYLKKYSNPATPATPSKILKCENWYS